MAATAGRTAGALAVLQLASIVAAAVLLSSPPAAAAEPSVDFIDVVACSQSQVDSIVRSAVQAALQREIALAAGLIRIFFHDCFMQGCDASVYLSGANSEQGMPPNANSLQPRALQLVEDIRAKVHAACGPTVSCTDISALATRAAVVLSGGPTYPVPLGQLDSLAPAPLRLVNQLPGPGTSSVQALIDLFGSRGMGDAADLVALSGGHTVGKSKCAFVRPVDDAFSRKMAANCSANPNTKQDLDVVTPITFDNGYYIALTRKQGVFTSDMALILDPQTAAIVRRFAQDKAAFFTQFVTSIVKLSKVPRPGGNKGEIRRNCFKTNSGARLVDVVEGFAASA
uniref:Peroxidase n=1 Tax=Oryza sativa subsp. japonica TaxID=39947 RepID=Q5U1N2_ORYSJ|nr:TPA: class III peroxidase 61 [Oryza sativa Japonica Group]